MENNCSQPEWIGETTQELSCVKPVEAESLPEQRLLADLASSAHDSQQPSVPQLVDSEKHTLSVEPFRPVIEMLQRLDQEDPKFAAPAARLVGLYRRLWESCVSKHVDNQRLGEATDELRNSNFQLSEERAYLKDRYDDQELRLAVFDQGLEKIREGIAAVLRDWHKPAPGEWAVPGEGQFQGGQ